MSDDPAKLRAVLDALLKARDASNRVVVAALDVVIEELMAALRLHEFDKDEQLTRLRHVIGCAVLALQSLAQAVEINRAPTESQEVH